MSYEFGSEGFRALVATAYHNKRVWFATDLIGFEDIMIDGPVCLVCVEDPKEHYTRIKTDNRYWSMTINQLIGLGY